MLCPKCGLEKTADAKDPHICVDCAKAENSRYNYLRQHQGDWMEAAKDAGVDVWLQQPGETQWEYTVWVKYRDSYPGKKPTYGSVAEELGTTKGVVAKIAQRWSFQARMQAWMTECDRVTLQQRRCEILSMNAEHISMAQKLRDKMAAAIDNIDPMALKPGEIATLFKLSAELERKARVDEITQDEMLRDMAHGGENPNLRKSPTKQSDLGEVLNILMTAGALGDITHIGVRETTTREVVAIDSTGQSARLESDDE